MSSKPFVALPASTAVGATLLGLSATLFAVDVAGTAALDADRAGPPDRAGTVIAQPSIPAASSQPDRGAQTAAAPQATAAPFGLRAYPPHVVPQGPALLPPRIARPQTLAAAAMAAPAKQRAVQPAAKHAAATAGETASIRSGLRPAAVAFALAPEGDASASPHVVSNVTLREVRRFVMRELQKKDKHVCVISAMTYVDANERVVVDLVFRDDKGRWLEKAVVRRGPSAVKLVGVRQRALPYTRLASTTVAPDP